MEINLQPVIAVLLFLLNIIGGFIWHNLSAIRAEIHDLRKFTHETRQKVDKHCENFAVHSLK